MKQISIFSPDGTNTAPSGTVVTNGYQPFTSLPASNQNYYFNAFSLQNAEIVSVLTAASIAPDPDVNTQLLTAINTLIASGGSGTQTANTVLAGPSTGSPAAASFRALVAADIPSLDTSKLGSGVLSVARGGIGVGTLTGIAKGNGTSAFTAASAGTDYVAPGSITTSALTMATSRILGRTTASAGAIEELTASGVLDIIGSTQGQILYRNASDWTVLAPGTAGQVLATGGAAANPSWIPAGGTGTVTSVAQTVPGLFTISGSPITTTGTLAIGLRDKLTGNAGLDISYSSSTTLGISSGWIPDSTGVNQIYLSSAFTKTTASFSAGTGNGALDTGTVAAGWYSVWAIADVTTPATPIVDILFSTSATSPTMPGTYTLKKRIGWMYVVSTGPVVIRSFIKVGYNYYWSVPVSDRAVSDVGNTTRNLLTVSAPINTLVLPTVYQGAATTFYIKLGATATTDTAASQTNFSLFANGTQASGGDILPIPVDASHQVFFRGSDSTSGNTLGFIANGWIDYLNI